MGGLIALQLAINAPGLVQSLALLEPLLMEVPSGPDVAPGVVPAIEAYQAGDPAGAVRLLVELGGGPESAGVLARCLPTALERAARDAGAFFEEEFLAIANWEMDDASWDLIYQPILSVVGEHSLPFFAEGREVLRSNCFDVENFDLFNASHLLQIENPEGMAAGLRSFFSRHPMR
jgi:pimeloyl-ACP methyl ester carboxylesterase